VVVGDPEAALEAVESTDPELDQMLPIPPDT
jgi:hypothetical protein